MSTSELGLHAARINYEESVEKLTADRDRCLDSLETIRIATSSGLWFDTSDQIGFIKKTAEKALKEDG